jgi:hypothetical protein
MYYKTCTYAILTQFRWCDCIFFLTKLVLVAWNYFTDLHQKKLINSVTTFIGVDEVVSR